MSEKTIVGMIILKTINDGETWVAVDPEQVPDFIKTDEAMNELVRGRFAGLDDGTWYRGVQVDIH
jgi:photosystem II stability/assembly factor-like uncharacterized protein